MPVDDCPSPPLALCRRFWPSRPQPSRSRAPVRRQQHASVTHRAPMRAHTIPPGLSVPPSPIHTDPRGLTSPPPRRPTPFRGGPAAPRADPHGSAGALRAWALPRRPPRSSSARAPTSPRRGPTERHSGARSRACPPAPGRRRLPAGLGSPPGSLPGGALPHACLPRRGLAALEPGAECRGGTPLPRSCRAPQWRWQNDRRNASHGSGDGGRGTGSNQVLLGCPPASAWCPQPEQGPENPAWDKNCSALPSGRSSKTLARTGPGGRSWEGGELL